MAGSGTRQLGRLHVRTDGTSLDFNRTLRPTLGTTLDILIPLVAGVDRFMTGGPGFISRVIVTTNTFLAVGDIIVTYEMTVLTLSMTAGLAPFK